MNGVKINILEKNHRLHLTWFGKRIAQSIIKLQANQPTIILIFDDNTANSSFNIFMIIFFSFVLFYGKHFLLFFFCFTFFQFNTTIVVRGGKPIYHFSSSN